jgi:hypothetical protein
MMLRRTSLIRLLHLGPAFKLVVHLNSIVARNPDEGLFTWATRAGRNVHDDGAAREKMSVNGNSRTWRDVRSTSAPKGQSGHTMAAAINRDFSAKCLGGSSLTSVLASNPVAAG